MKPDFSTVTEVPGLRATREQRSMLYTRYHLAGTYSIDKDVLEVGCGAGLGLGYMARSARSVTGVDIDETNLRIASESYRGHDKVVLRRQDADKLDFPDNSFDTLVLFEVIYYLRDVGRLMAEAQRVLRPGANLIVCSVNRRWHGFNPSPHSTRYLDADELRQLLDHHGYTTRVYAGFPARSGSPIASVIAAIRSLAVRLRIIPKTMKGKEWLKRLFYGHLAPLDHEVRDQMATLASLVELTPQVDARPFKVLYAHGCVDKESMTREAA